MNPRPDNAKQLEKFFSLIEKLKELEYVEESSIKSRSWIYNQKIRITLLVKWKTGRFFHWNQLESDTKIEINPDILYVDSELNSDFIKIALSCNINL